MDPEDRATPQLLTRMRERGKPVIRLMLWAYVMATLSYASIRAYKVYRARNPVVRRPGLWSR